MEKIQLRTEYNRLYGFKSAIIDHHLRRKPECCEDCVHYGTGNCGNCKNYLKMRRNKDVRKSEE